MVSLLLSHRAGFVRLNLRTSEAWIFRNGTWRDNQALLTSQIVPETTPAHPGNIAEGTPRYVARLEPDLSDFTR